MVNEIITQKISFTVSEDEIEDSKKTLKEISYIKAVERISKEIDMELYDVAIEDVLCKPMLTTHEISVDVWYIAKPNEVKIKELREIQERLEVGL